MSNKKTVVDILNEAAVLFRVRGPISKVNWIAIDSNGEMFGFTYKPKYHSMEWTQAIDHPELDAYEYFYGKVTKPVGNISGYVIKTIDLVDNYAFDADLFNEIVQPAELFRVYNAILPDHLILDHWVAMSKGWTVAIFDSEPYASNNTFRHQNYAKVLGNIKYVADSGKNWKHSKITIQGMINILKQHGYIPSQDHVAQDVPVPTAIAEMERYIKSKEYEIAVLQGDIHALKLAIRILTK